VRGEGKCVKNCVISVIVFVIHISVGKKKEEKNTIKKKKRKRNYSVKKKKIMASCTGKKFDDGGVDFSSSAYGHAGGQDPYGYLGSDPGYYQSAAGGGGEDPYEYAPEGYGMSVPQQQVSPSPYGGRGEAYYAGAAIEPEYSPSAYSDPSVEGVVDNGSIPVHPEDFLTLSIPFDMHFVPADLDKDNKGHIEFALNKLKAKPFSSPVNKELSDGALLGGVKLTMKKNFGDDLVVQASLREPGAENELLKDPKPWDNPIHERISGNVMLGDHKKMEVHGLLRDDEKTDIHILDAPTSYHSSFLQAINAGLPDSDKWTHTKLLSTDVAPAPGNYGENDHNRYMVKRGHPVMAFIDHLYDDPVKESILSHYGDHHVIVGKDTFVNHADLLVKESARNVTLGDFRKNFKLYVLRNVPQEGPVSSNVWSNPKGIFDKLQEDRMDDAMLLRRKKEILGKKYTIKGNLLLSYYPSSFNGAK
jgi:hypothetical protein